MTDMDPFPLLPEFGVESTGSNDSTGMIAVREDLGYDDDDDNSDNQPINTSSSACSHSSQQSNSRPRTPRELLRKMPRRLSAASNTSLDSSLIFSEQQHQQQQHDENNATPAAQRMTPTHDENAAESATTTPKPGIITLPEPTTLFSQEDEPINMQQGLLPNSNSSNNIDHHHQGLPCRVAKPVPSRRRVSSTATSISGFQKPVNPEMQKEMRKALYIQSRRRSSLSSAASATDTISLSDDKKRPSDSVGVVVGGGGCLPDLNSNSNRNNTQATATYTAAAVVGSTSKCVPLAGFRDGTYVFSGIVMRRDGRNTKSGRSKKVAFIRLDDPNGPLDGSGHLMNKHELWTELACYEGIPSFVEHHSKVHRSPVVDYETGVPLLSWPQLAQGTSWTQEGGPLIGLANLLGHEGHFQFSKPFDCYFPYLSYGAPGPTPSASTQGVKAGDVVTVIVCIRNGVDPYATTVTATPPLVRKELDVCVLSVTSFGFVNGAPIKTKDSKNELEILSFPITCILGVKYGKNWQQTSPAPYQSPLQMPPAMASLPTKQGF